MHILLYGGSFSPIHNAHLALARHAAGLQEVSEVWLVVSPRNPLKPAAVLWDADVRAALAEAALREAQAVHADAAWQKVRVSRVEFSLPRPSFTLQTLEALRRRHPADRFSLLIGSDSYLDLPRWHRVDEIRRTTHIYVYPRPNYPLPADEPEGFTFLREAPQSTCSSTEIRRLLAAHDPKAQSLVPPAVWRAVTGGEV